MYISGKESAKGETTSNNFLLNLSTYVYYTDTTYTYYRN